MLRGQDETQRLLWARMEAATHETSLPPTRRKELGQFFTGVPLARVLAALTVNEQCDSVVDPMAGTGDLFDGVLERMQRTGGRLSCLDGIEICESTAAVCHNRLAAWQESIGELPYHLMHTSAFAPETLEALSFCSYGLVITNPPYVRYQTVSGNGRGDGGSGNTGDDVRRELLRAAQRYPRKAEMPVWRALVEGYSGLADLSVPAWLLAAMLVRPGGKLALVAPATWRSRDYADVLLYLLARFFRLDAVVADRQRGWFSSALVRTHLVVATRLGQETTVQPLAQREQAKGSCRWVEIAPDAQGGDSLVGGAFPVTTRKAILRDGCSPTREMVGCPTASLWKSVPMQARQQRFCRGVPVRVGFPKSNLLRATFRYSEAVLRSPDALFPKLFRLFLTSAPKSYAL